MTSKVNRLNQYLGELKDASYEDPKVARRHNSDVDAALQLIFHIGREGTALTGEQKKTLAKNLVNALTPIQINVERSYFENKNRKRLNTLILKKRSALQFLVDKYGEISVGNSNLNTEFERVNLKETIGILDGIIDDLRDEVDSDDPASDREVSGIPSSHSWWF